MADELTRLQRVTLHTLARKPRTLRELAADMPGENWTVRNISEALLELRAGGYVRFIDGSWHSGAEWGKVGHADTVVKGHGPWDVAAGPMPGDLDAATKRPMIRFACGWGF